MAFTFSSFIGNLFGNKYEKEIKLLAPLVEAIHAASSTILTISDDELREKTTEFKGRITEALKSDDDKIEEIRKKIKEEKSLTIFDKEDLYNDIDKIEEGKLIVIEKVLLEILPEAFAVVKETARRYKENDYLEVTAKGFDEHFAAERDSVEIVDGKARWNSSWNAAGTIIKWDMLHYDVQLKGGIILHQGKIAEMATGEGKTLVATLPVYLNALAGKGVHIITVNDYLAKRDSEWMGPLYEFHGLTVDCIDRHTPNSPERRKAYAADITFGTNNEFGFDYLRDNMASSVEDLVQRKQHYSIVDEVDSVLIDDARTPLIISGPTPMGDKHEFNELKPKVERLMTAQRKFVQTALSDAKRLLAEAAVEGLDKKQAEEKEDEGCLALLRSYRGLPKNKALIKFLSEPEIKTKLQKTENFYMQDQSKNMHIVDDELYFTIEESHNSIDLKDKGINLITSDSDDPYFYIMPDIGGDIVELEKSGLPDDEMRDQKAKLIESYGEKSERIHTINQLLKAYTLFEKDVEYVIMDNKVKIVDESTGRIMDGRRYSDGLHQAIEAKENTKIEAATQTYASVTLQNYFRMYHKLCGMTGTAETEAGEFWNIYDLDVVVIPTNKPIIRDDREDFVYKTQREKYQAVIDEIVELTKAGRPVLVGTTSVEISELLGKMLNMKKIKHNVLNAKLHQREAEVVASAGFASAVTIATNMAGRGTDIKLSPEVIAAGGLAIIGTERHESRRVDRQLRGRSGRQGDPGSTQFFVSLEDNLMRLFGSERIAKIMDRMGIEEGEVIQHSMITKSIERAQKKVEENHFGVRKRLLEYDDVMNAQREVIYKKRKNALYGERLNVDVSNSLNDVCSSLIEEYKNFEDYEGFKYESLKTLAVDPNLTESELGNEKSDDLSDKLFLQAHDTFKAKNKVIIEAALPLIKDVLERQSSYEQMVIPFTDKKIQLRAVVNLVDAVENEGSEIIVAFQRSVSLTMIDDAWKEHLREMDDLRQTVQNAVYEQKDPLLIYKFESFGLFKTMIDEVNKKIVSFLMKGGLPHTESEAAPKLAPVEERKPQKLETSKSEFGEGGNSGQGGAPKEKEKVAPVRVEKKVGRNDNCPCGSGKKFKHCHGK
ncbi:MAG: preprotein translocase subunit SecA [Flavobacteriales bacterium]|nr:preprotein translocase subunit SecA [Flavobacteriales bacterium]